MVKEKEVVDLSNLHNAGKVQIEISKRELKYNANDNVVVYKIVEGKKVPTAYMQYTDIEGMHETYTQEEIDILACANLLVRCQNIARAWDKPKASKVDPAIANALKSKDLTDEQKDKVIAYLSKL